MTAFLVLGLMGGLIAVIFFARKAGGDAARSGAAQAALQAITKAEKPVTEKELADVRKKYRRE